MKVKSKRGIDLSESTAGCSLGAELLKMVAHPVRLRLLAVLCRGESRVGELAQRIESPPAIVSQQLRLLRMRELVAVRRAGGHAIYRLAEYKLRRVIQCLEECVGHRLREGG